MQRVKTLLIEETSKFPKVEEFLNLKSRRSQQTKKSYLIALAHFQTFLSNSKYDYNIESVLIPLSEKSISLYSLFNDFVDYLLLRKDLLTTKLSPATISFYIAGVKSYLQYYDIDISSKKFQNKVTLPDKYHGNADGIDINDIRKILDACDNTRLKAFILVLASSGMRALEACSLRNRDLKFTQSPTGVHIRAVTTKTKQSNDIYISDEATKKLQTFIEAKYKINYDSAVAEFPDELVFGKEKEVQPINIYKRLQEGFADLLRKIGMDRRKDGEGLQRREISFHSFRRFVKTTISNLGYPDYSEWLLGHRSSMSARYYYTKESERREIYKKCMTALIFLDIHTIEAVGKDLVSKMEESKREVEQLRGRVNKLEKLEKIVLDVIESKGDLRKTSEDSINGLEELGYLETSDTYKKERKKYKNTKVF